MLLQRAGLPNSAVRNFQYNVASNPPTHAVRCCERVWWRTMRREWRRALGVYPLRCVRRHRAARTEIARLRYGRP